MKFIKTTIITAVLLVTSICSAQDAAVNVFAEAGEKFTLTINGEKKNDVPQTKVRVTGLSSGVAYKASILIENNAAGNIVKNIYPNPGMEATLNLKLNKKGKYVLRFMGETPYDANSASTTVVTTTSQPANTNVNTNVSTNNNGASSTTTTTTTTSSTSTNTTTPDGENVGISMNINVDETNGNASISMNVNDGTENGNVNMNVNVNDANMNSSTSTTTTTTTTSSSSYNTNNTAPVYQEQTTTTTTSTGRCDFPMDNSDFVSAKSSISSKTFSDSKMTMAKQVVKAHCPTSEQIKEFTKLFDFESGKLEFAKFAYQYVYDKANYYKVNDAFEFESTIEELNEHIGK